jgi:hypothetical protein
VDHIKHVTELRLHTNMNSEEKSLIHSLKEWTKPPHKDTKHYGPQNFLTMMHSNNNNILVPPGSPLPYLLYLLLPSQSLQIVISQQYFLLHLPTCFLLQLLLSTFCASNEIYVTPPTPPLSSQKHILS